MAGETVITIVANRTADPELRTIGSGATAPLGVIWPTTAPSP